MARADLGGPPVATCTRHGQQWRIDWNGRSLVVADSVGMLYLSTLINNPGQEIKSIELAAGLPTLTGTMTAATSTQPVLDRTAVQHYRQRLAELSTDIDEYEADGDQERAAKGRAERDWLVNELSAATGLGAVMRSFTDNTERARSATGKAIRRMMTRITVADAEIGAHLAASVRTGILCSYRPAEANA
jgi:hypothetical protein